MSTSAKSKDASTRFMRVDQLGSAPTVAVPASELLAAARRSQDEIATRAMPLVPPATPPAPTVVMPRRSEGVRVDAEPGARARSNKSSHARWTRGRTARAGVMALVAASLVAFTATRARHPKRAEGTAATGPKTAAQAVPARVVVKHEDIPSTPSPAPAPMPRSTSTEPTPAPRASAGTVSPSVAVDQLAAGDYAAALTSYRELALARPEEPVFALIVVLLDRKQHAGCTGDDPVGASSCAR